MTPSNEKFGNYLCGLRDQCHLTQREAAKQAQISSPYLAQIEKGQRNPPSALILNRLAKVYGVAPMELLKVARLIDEQPALPDPMVVERAFLFVCHDPEFPFGRLIRNQEISREVKAVIVVLYQNWKGKCLLNDEEISAAITESASAA